MTDTRALEQNIKDGEQKFKISSPAILEVRRARIIAVDIADEPEENKQNVLNGYEDMAKDIGRSPAELLETGERIIQNDKEIDQLYADAVPGRGSNDGTFKKAYNRIAELRGEVIKTLRNENRSPIDLAQAMRIIQYSAPLSMQDKEQWQHIDAFVHAAPELLQDKQTAQAIFTNLEQQRYFYDLDPNDMTDRRSQRNFERWRDETYNLIALMTEKPTNLSREQRETIQNWHYMREGNQYYQKLGDASRPYIDGKALETNTVVENIRTAAYSALPDRIKSQIDEGEFYKMLEERRIDFSRYSGDTNNLLPEVAGLIAEAIPGLAGKEFFALGLVQNIGVYARDASTAYTGARVLRVFTGEQTVIEYRNSHPDSQWAKELGQITVSKDKGLNPLFSAISGADVDERSARVQAEHDAEAAKNREEERLRQELEKQAAQPGDGTVSTQSDVSSEEASQPAASGEKTTSSTDSGQQTESADNDNTLTTDVATDKNQRGLGSLIKNILRNR